MKKTFKTLALFIGLSLVAVSCQKELYFENDAATENTDNIICVTYTIDGLTMCTTFKDDASWKEFLQWLFALAEEGHYVSFGDTNRTNSVAKETVTYVTDNHDNAVAWSDMMVKKGYQVNVFFDDKTHTYTCVATK